MFNFSDESAIMNNIIRQGAAERITDEQFIVREIDRFKLSRKRHDMITGIKYYKGKHDILYHKRTVIGEDGNLKEIDNLPNEKIVDNQYKKMVMQKNNYLLGQPFSIHCDNEEYVKLLQKDFFNKKFFSLMLKLGVDFLNCGISWLYATYDQDGKLSFKRLRPYEIIPGWKDADHTILEYAIHLYSIIKYEGTDDEKVIELVDVLDENGIYYFELSSDNKLIPIEPYHSNYFTISIDDNEQGYNWSRLPLIPLKYNDDEIPLINHVKSLQDGINTIESNFLNCMEEDVRNTILVLVNYDGENLGEFRKNLSTYGAVKVRTIDGSPGDLKTLQVEVNAENYKAILEIFKKAIIENAMGYDAKDDRLSGNPNEMNIQSMYSDIDLDANGVETLLQAAFEEILWFINAHLYNTGYGDFENELVDIIFNRDMLINESTVIDNCTKSIGILSDETIVANHPWVDDPQHELERLKKQKQESIEQYRGAFTPKTDDNDGDDET